MLSPNASFVVYEGGAVEVIICRIIVDSQESYRVDLLTTVETDCKEST